MGELQNVCPNLSFDSYPVRADSAGSFPTYLIALLIWTAFTERWYL